MRILKFRVWDNEKKRMSIPLPVYSPFVKWNDGDIEMPTDFALAKIHRFVFLQFTDIFDKNGNDIYEGDVIHYDQHYSTGSLKELIVAWENNNCCYRGFYNEDSGHILKNFDSSHYEIIGNIYENPELKL